MRIPSPAAQLTTTLAEQHRKKQQKTLKKKHTRAPAKLQQTISKHPANTAYRTTMSNTQQNAAATMEVDGQAMEVVVFAKEDMEEIFDAPEGNHKSLSQHPHLLFVYWHHAKEALDFMVRGDDYKGDMKACRKAVQDGLYTILGENNHDHEYKGRKFYSFTMTPLPFDAVSSSLPVEGTDVLFGWFCPGRTYYWTSKKNRDAMFEHLMKNVVIPEESGEDTEESGEDTEEAGEDTEESPRPSVYAVRNGQWVCVRETNWDGEGDDPFQSTAEEVDEYGFEIHWCSCCGSNVLNSHPELDHPQGDDDEDLCWECVAEDEKEEEERYCAKYCRCGTTWDFDEDGDKYCQNCCPR